MKWVIPIPPTPWEKWRVKEKSKEKLMNAIEWNNVKNELSLSLSLVLLYKVYNIILCNRRKDVRARGWIRIWFFPHFFLMGTSHCLQHGREKSPVVSKVLLEKVHRISFFSLFFSSPFLARRSHRVIYLTNPIPYTWLRMKKEEKKYLHSC